MANLDDYLNDVKRLGYLSAETWYHIVGEHKRIADVLLWRLELSPTAMREKLENREISSTQFIDAWNNEQQPGDSNG